MEKGRLGQKSDHDVGPFIVEERGKKFDWGILDIYAGQSSTELMQTSYVKSDSQRCPVSSENVPTSPRSVTAMLRFQLGVAGGASRVMNSRWQS